jgi:hypothetical protein
VGFSEVSSNLLGIEGQYGSKYITGELEDYPVLGRGLRFNGLGTSGHTHHAIGIHPDDIEEFVRRHAAYWAYEKQSVVDNEGCSVRLDQFASNTLRGYLDSFGAYDRSSDIRAELSSTGKK